MKMLVIVLIASFMTGSNLVLFDFNSPESAGKWYTVNDDVMGGLSSSSLTNSQIGMATFSGKLSQENNGGFASIRSTIQNVIDKKSSGVKLRIRGDGRI